MSASMHCRLIAYSFVTWLSFYLIGLPDYYQSWPFWGKVVLCVLVTLLYFPVTAYSLRTFWDDGAYTKNALWLAFYLTLPLFVYDYLLLAVYKELGIMFVVPYWYLTLFYFSFWVQFPLVALWLNREMRADSA